MVGFLDTVPGIPGNPLGLSPGRLEIQTGTTGGMPAYIHSLQKAELDSHHRVGSENNNVAITQLLPSCPLTGYRFTYSWKSRTQKPGDNDVQVFVNDKKVGMHQQNMGWQKEEWYFVSDTLQTLIWFDSVGTESTTGMFLDEVSVIGPDGSYEEPCTLICDDKPRELTLRYDGDDDSNHHQSGNEVVIFPEDVNDTSTFPDPATIEVYGHKWKNPKLLRTYDDVPIGEFFSVSGPHKRIPPRLTFKIYDPDDRVTPVQTVTFHTSCSQPMDAGDEFGAITVWSAIN